MKKPTAARSFSISWRTASLSMIAIAVIVIAMGGYAVGSYAQLPRILWYPTPGGTEFDLVPKCTYVASSNLIERKIGNIGKGSVTLAPNPAIMTLDLWGSTKVSASLALTSTKILPSSSWFGGPETNFPLPESILKAPGQYSGMCCVIQLKNDTNNSNTCQTFVIDIPGPDATALPDFTPMPITLEESVDPTTLQKAAKITVTVKNIGASSVQASITTSLDYRISTPAAVLPGTTSPARTVTPAAGASTAVSFYIVPPRYGDYHITACTDTNNLVTETHEKDPTLASNNCTYVTLRLDPVYAFPSSNAPSSSDTTSSPPSLPTPTSAAALPSSASASSCPALTVCYGIMNGDCGSINVALYKSDKCENEGLFTRIEDCWPVLKQQKTGTVCDVSVTVNGQSRQCLPQ